MIYVIVASYLDRSGALLLGVYENSDEAADRVLIATAAHPAMSVRVVPMKLGQCDPQEVFES
jgi:hypothetical protein